MMREKQTRAILLAALVAPMAMVSTGAIAAGCGGGSGGGGDGDAGVPAIALAIVGPAGETYTNRSINIEVSVTPMPPAELEVQLLKNGVPFAGVRSPYAFLWDTMYAAEGSYDIQARAMVGGREVTSGSVKVIVDRTPPAIVSQTPVAGDPNLSLRDPIRVVFSEGLAPASVPSGAVRLENASGLVASTAKLGSDGKTVDVTIANPALVAVPGDLRLSVTTSVTDLAGNAYVAVAPTAWKVPAWVDLGSPMTDVQEMAIAGGRLVVAGGSPLVGAARYSGGTSWESLGSPQTTACYQTKLAVDHYGSPTLAWLHTADVDGNQVTVARWEETGWKTLGRLSSADSMVSPSIYLAMDSQARPAVEWGDLGRYTLARWNGTTWQLPFGSGPIGGHRIVFGGQDQPALIVPSGRSVSPPGVMRWTASSWARFDYPDTSEEFQLLRFDAMERLMVVTRSGRVLRGDAFGEIVPVGPAAFGSVPSYAFDSHDYPIVAWRQDDVGVVHVARWTGTAWANLANPKRPDDPSEFGAWPLVAVDANDAVVVTWNEWGTDAAGKDWHRTFVRRTNR